MIIPVGKIRPGDVVVGHHDVKVEAVVYRNGLFTLRCVDGTELGPMTPAYSCEVREPRPSEMSLRPRPGETAEDVIARVTAAAKKRTALEAIVTEINTGLIDDETCARRLDEIGATDEELEHVLDEMGG